MTGPRLNLRLTLMAIVAMALYPPWYFPGDRQWSGDGLGYSFITSPPEVGARIDFELFAFQTGIALTIGLIFRLGRR